MKLQLNLTSKLTLIFVLFAALLLAVISVLAYNNGRSGLESAAVSELLATAIEKQSALNDWVTDARIHATSISASPDFQAKVAALLAARTSGDQAEIRVARNRLVEELQVWTGQGRDYLGWVVLESNFGQVIASTDIGEEGKFREDQPYFINGKSGPYLQNLYYSLSAQATRLTISAPIRSENGTLLGVLAGNLDLEKIKSIISRRTGLRQSDDAFLLNTSSLFVTQPRFISDPAVLLRGVHTEAVNRCLERNSGVVAAPDYRDVPSLIVYRWLSERELCLIVKMDQAEALAPTLALRNNIFIASLLALLFASLLSWWLARTITRPVQRLAEAAQEIGAGKLETRIEVKTGDEIGQLAGAFVQMAHDLQKTLVSRDDLLEEVAERKRVEHALRDSQSQVNGIISSAMDAILTIDEEQKIIVFNPSAEQMFGCPASEALGQTLDRFLPDYVRKEQREYLRVIGNSNSSKRSMNPPALALTCLRANGETFSSEVSISQLEIGGQKLYTAIVRDTTERKRMEDALRENEAHLRKAQQIGKLGSWIFDLTGRMRWSDEMYRIYGVSPETFSLDPESFIQLIHPDDQATMQEWISACTAGENPEALEFRAILPDGSVRFISGRGELIRNADRIPLYLSGTAQDITERKRAENALAERHATLNAILESSATPVFSLDRDYRYTSFNNSHAAVMRALYQVEIQIGGSLAEYQHVPADWLTAKKNLDRALGGEQIIESSYSGEPGGARRYFDIAHNPIYAAGGEVIGVSVFVSDITERKQAEEALQEYSARLEAEVTERTRELREAQEQLVRQERLATLGQLAGSIGHELRNPLGVISNAIYYLKLSQPEASNQVKEYLEIIEKETRTSDKIVTDLLDFTRLKSLARKPVSVAYLVDQTLERYPTPPAVQVLLEIPTDLPKIFADPQQIVQVLGNLVINAFQSMVSTSSTTQAGSLEQTKLRISAIMQDDMIKLAVQDTGIGIAPENLSKLFEPLFTTKTKGIGLGLAVSKKLTEANGGKIEVESTLGQGSTFTIHLPIYESAPVSKQDQESK